MVDVKKNEQAFARCSLHFQCYRSHIRDADLSRVIVKSGVSASESSGGLIDCCHLDSIFEFNSRNYLRQVIKPA